MLASKFPYSLNLGMASLIPGFADNSDSYDRDVNSESLLSDSVEEADKRQTKHDETRNVLH